MNGEAEESAEGGKFKERRKSDDEPRSPPYGFVTANATGPIYHVAAIPTAMTGMQHAMLARQAIPGGSFEKSLTSFQSVGLPVRRCCEDVDRRGKEGSREVRRWRS
jgi:hypothetical protein